MPEQPPQLPVGEAPRTEPSARAPFDVHLRGLDVTIVPSGITDIQTTSTASLGTKGHQTERGLENAQRHTLGEAINADATTKENVRKGMNREMQFQMKEALGVLTGDVPIPQHAEHGKSETSLGNVVEKLQRYPLDPSEVRKIQRWISEGTFSWEYLQQLLSSDPSRMQDIVTALRGLYVDFMRQNQLVAAQQVTIEQPKDASGVLAEIKGAARLAFPLFSQIPDKLEEFVQPLAGVLYAITNDGQLVFNVRQLRNANWKQVPGGIAGMAHSTSTHPSMQTLLNHLLAEGTQEAGLTPDDFSHEGGIRILGFAHATTAASEQRPRWEALGVSRLNLNEQEVRQRVKAAEKSPTALSRQDFAEGDVRFLPATSETIQKLVQFRSYWPTTHLAGLLALGYTLRYEELLKQYGNPDDPQTQEKAHVQAAQWVKEVLVPTADATYDEIDRQVAAFYAANPQRQQEAEEKGQHTDSFDATVPPADTFNPKHPAETIPGQGLPTVDEEIARLFS